MQINSNADYEDLSTFLYQVDIMSASKESWWEILSGLRLLLLIYKLLLILIVHATLSLSKFVEPHLEDKKFLKNVISIAEA